MATSVLIVDDDEDMRVLVRAMLGTASGITVIGEAADGTEALARVDDLDPDVVVLDQMMPGMTGLEAARVMLERRPAQAIVLFSAFLSDAVREEAGTLGVSACLTKDQVGAVAETVLAVA